MTLSTAPGQDGALAGETLRLEWPRPHVALVTFTRPGERNTITLAMIEELRQILDRMQQARPAALIFTGSDSAFCAGADLKLLTSKTSGFFESPSALRDHYLAPLARLFDSFEEMPFPIVAAVNGFALGGGCEMALSADLRIASDTATFSLPEVRLGATPGAGGVQKLIRHVGRAKALEWILLASKVSAAQAEARGLVVEVVASHALIQRAIELGERLAQGGPQALAQAKASIYLSEDADLRTARRFGVEALTSLAATDEWREGVRAFIEKRAPRFRSGAP